MTATYQDGDSWRPLKAYLPSAGPLPLRLAFTSDMFPDTVERALRGPHTKDGGSQRQLAELPPEPQGGNLSPDGKWLRTTSQQPHGGSGQPDWQHLVVDLTTGQAKSIAPEESWGYWLPNNEVLMIRPQGADKLVLTLRRSAGNVDTVISDVPPHGSTMLSPDGKAIALLAYDQANTAYPYIGGPFHAPSWSPDGRHIALTQPLKGGTSLVVADVAAGALHTLSATLPADLQITGPVSWSPDGTRILVGHVLIDAATGSVAKRIPALAHVTPFWSGDGEWLLSQLGEWEEVTAYHLRTGKSVRLGKGLPLGWSADGRALLIRWPGSALRTHSGI